MDRFLSALALQNYRGIGPSWQKMRAFRQFNFFIGANNAGKSTVLNFISRHLPMRLRGSPDGVGEVDPLETNRGPANDSIRMAVGIPIERAIQHLLRGVDDERNRTKAKDILEVLLKGLGDNGLVWIGGRLPDPEHLDLFPFGQFDIEPTISPDQWHVLWMIVTHQSEGSLSKHWIPETLTHIRQTIPVSLARTRLIPAIRQIGSKDERFQDYSGAGLIDRLAEIQSPDHDRRSDRNVFDRINSFLQDVTARPDARIEVPHNRQHILVHMDGRILPISSLGTGIHEVVMIAAFCTISQNEIMCIEEPELHLHPLLQRKLVAYLKQYTSNQYFIATHSASFIDTPEAAMFDVTLEAGATQIKEAILKKARYAICMDLGHRASDILQSNTVIWVEGPSDRIYLNHWISSQANDLKEGTHYSIMFYGGRLLSHLKADYSEVDEFIELRSLNRNLAIVIDSDRASAHARINDTKTRIQKEFDEHGGYAWVTKGQEVENYVPHSLLQSAVAKVYGDAYGTSSSGGQFDHALYFERRAPKKSRTKQPSATMEERNVDKVKVAREVCRHSADLSMFDIEKRIKELVTFIRAAND